MRSIKTNQSSNRTANKLKNSRTNNEIVPFQRPWRKRTPNNESKEICNKNPISIFPKEKIECKNKIWESLRNRASSRNRESYWMGKTTERKYCNRRGGFERVRETEIATWSGDEGRRSQKNEVKRWWEIENRNEGWFPMPEDSGTEVCVVGFKAVLECSTPVLGGQWPRELKECWDLF